MHTSWEAAIIHTCFQVSSKVIRYIRNTNKDNDLQHALSQFKLNLMARDY